jgi:thymidylate synthase ThyX
MAYAAKIIADSVSPAKVRLTTFEITYPKFVHNELMTHRMFSRNTASSRAIPFKKTVEQVVKDPVMPVWWGRNQAGMQAKEELNEEIKTPARMKWLNARDQAVEIAYQLDALGVHKQLVNRIIEPWMWITAIVTATDFDNFFHLRCHPDAQPEIKEIAEMMRDLYHGASDPFESKFWQEQLGLIGWHLPYVRMEDLETCTDIEALCRISTARCARVSYLTHDGKRDHSEDLKLCKRLEESGHWSPFEHVARPAKESDLQGFAAAARLLMPAYLSQAGYFGNFRGWIQFRKQFQNEYCTQYSRAEEVGA